MIDRDLKHGTVSFGVTVGSCGTERVVSVSFSGHAGASGGIRMCPIPDGVTSLSQLLAWLSTTVALGGADERGQ